MIAPPKYSAFISYSRKDRPIALWLQNHLESYRIPNGLREKAKSTSNNSSRILPMFRDEDELRATNHLTKQIHEALSASTWLIVICSPDARSSKWVNEEILEYRRLKGDGNILCVIADGEPFAIQDHASQASCFPPALFLIEPKSEAAIHDNKYAIPLAADLRDRKARKVACLKILATIIDVQLDELRQRDRERRNRQYVITFFLANAALAVFSWLAINYATARAEARRQADELAANSRRTIAEKLSTKSLAILNQEINQSATEAWLLAVESANLQASDKTSEAVQMAAMQARQQFAYFKIDGEVNGLAFSPDERHLAISYNKESLTSVSNDSFLRIWSVVDSTFEGNPIRANCGNNFHFSQNGESILCNQGFSLSVVELHGDKKGERSSNYWKLSREPQIASIDLSPVDSKIIAMLDDGSLETWSYDSLEPLGDAFFLGGMKATSIVSNRNGSLLSASFKNGEIQVFDSKTFRPVSKRQNLGAKLRSQAFSEDSKTLVGELEDGRFFKLEFGAREKQPTYTEAFRKPQGKNWISRPDGLITTSWDQGNSIHIIYRNHSTSESISLVGDSEVSMAAIGRISQLVGVASKDSSIRIWKPSLVNPLVSRSLTTDKEVSALANHLSLLAIAMVNGVVRVVDLNRQQDIGFIHVKDRKPIMRLAFSKNGELLFGQNGDAELSAWRIPAFETISIDSAASLLEMLGWPSAGDPSAAMARRFMGQETVSTDKLVARTVNRQDIELIRNGSPSSESVLLRGHTKKILALAVNESRSLLASGGEDKTVRIWNTSTKQAVGMPLIHGNQVSALTFTADGNYLFSASHDLLIRQWNVNSDSWVRDICEKVPRQLTKDEWNASVGSEIEYKATCNSNRTLGER